MEEERVEVKLKESKGNWQQPFTCTWIKGCQFSTSGSKKKRKKDSSLQRPENTVTKEHSSPGVNVPRVSNLGVFLFP